LAQEPGGREQNDQCGYSHDGCKDMSPHWASEIAVENALF
jgi:hypothetical protein